MDIHCRSHSLYPALVHCAHTSCNMRRVYVRVQGCPAGATFSGFTGNDMTAATTLAPSLTIWVNAPTLSGQVPVKAAGASVVSYISNTVSCNPRACVSAITVCACHPPLFASPKFCMTVHMHATPLRILCMSRDARHAHACTTHPCLS